MKLGLLQKDELVETLAREFYAIQGYQIPQDYRMQSSINSKEKACVAMALFALQTFQSLDCVPEPEVTQEVVDTQKVTEWFSEFWRYGDREQIRVRVQDSIICYGLTESEIDKLGAWTWEDFSNFKKITKRYPMPSVKEEQVDWKKVGVFIYELFGLNFEDDEQDKDDDD